MNKTVMILLTAAVVAVVLLVVLLGGGKDKLSVKRETYEDLVRNDM